MSKIVLMALVLLVSSLVCGAVAGDGNAGDAAHFLRNGFGMRQRGMGTAGTALSYGMSASFWNPAPPIQSDSIVVGGELENRNQGLFQFSYLGGGFDVGAMRFGAVVLTSDFYDMYLLAGGTRLGPLAIGVGTKLYHFGVPGARGTGLGFDSGIRWTTHLGSTQILLAAVFRDIGWTKIMWQELGEVTVDRVAWVNRIAAAVAFPVFEGKCSFEVDLEFATDRPSRVSEDDYWEKAGDINLSLGLEFSWFGIAIRAGLQRYDLATDGRKLEPTFGVGVSLDAITIDLAVVPSFLGNTYLGGFQVNL